MTVGQEGSSVKVLKQCRVLDIHDKYYNKWFMSKVPQVFLERTPHKYKLEISMQKVSAVHINTAMLTWMTPRYKREVISRLLTDGEVKDVLSAWGKLIIWPWVANLAKINCLKSKLGYVTYSIKLGILKRIAWPDIGFLGDYTKREKTPEKLNMYGNF